MSHSGVPPPTVPLPDGVPPPPAPLPADVPPSPAPLPDGVDDGDVPAANNNVLKKYTCPLKKDCHLQSSDMCPFTHGRREALHEAVCVLFLLGECQATVHPFGAFPCCAGGLHPPLHLLAQPKVFRLRLKELLIGCTMEKSFQIQSQTDQTQKEKTLAVPVSKRPLMCTCTTTVPLPPLYAILDCKHYACGHCYFLHRQKKAITVYSIFVRNRRVRFSIPTQLTLGHKNGKTTSKLKSLLSPDTRLQSPTVVHLSESATSIIF